MARLSKKNLKDLSLLPEGWQTREELLSMLLDDPRVVESGRQNQAGMLPEGVDGFVRILFMKNSWQLTSWGAVAMISVCQSWTLEHDDNAVINGRILLNMGKIIKSPWYNRGRHVYVWNQGVHFEMQMFDGSIRRFVDFYLK